MVLNDALSVIGRAPGKIRDMEEGIPTFYGNLRSLNCLPTLKTLGTHFLLKETSGLSSVLNVYPNNNWMEGAVFSKMLSC